MVGTFKRFIAPLLLIILGIIVIGIAIFTLRQSPPDTQSPSSQTDSITIAAVGDLACEPTNPDFDGNNPEKCQMPKVAELIRHHNPAAVLLLGDIQYDKGQPLYYQQSFGKDWGNLIERSYPVLGNHDIGEGSGYFEYFQEAPETGEPGKGYYSFDIGKWHIIGLNSNCEELPDGCGMQAKQVSWLQEDLATSTAVCTAAMWHHPHLTSGGYRNDSSVSSRSNAFWDVLQQADAEIVLSGHDHLYERFASINASGQPSDDGLRQFVSGGGGRSLGKVSVPPLPQSEKTIDDEFGILLLELKPESYSWKFVDIKGNTRDQGEAGCH